LAVLIGYTYFPPKKVLQSDASDNGGLNNLDGRYYIRSVSYGVRGV